MVMEPNYSDFRIEKATRLLNENSSRTVAEVAGGCSHEYLQAEPFV
jgi:transcriptional regulator GlxA family with amidase domain